jgi:hypothetical protein
MENVTAPVAPDTVTPVPATADVTPELVNVTTAEVTPELVNVTAPVAPDTEIPVPATADVTAENAVEFA